MVRIPICPVCTEPVADQPAQHWTDARRGGAAPWWHLVDNTPICPAVGRHAQAVFVEDTLPVDSETDAWLDAMEGLFAADGPSDPARLGSALTAAEHLTRWLHTATGPFSALMALPRHADVGVLLGHLHRSARLLARVHAQIGSYLLDRSRQARLTGPDDSDGAGDVLDTVDDVHAWLQAAADWSARSAFATGVAWSGVRAAVAPMTTTEHADEYDPDGVADVGGPRPAASVALTVKQLIELLNDLIREHRGNPVLRDPVLIDINGERRVVGSVELRDITDECRRTDCHCAYGQDDPPEDAPQAGVHFAVLLHAASD
ncbi:hypothetical protein [Micromonospora fluostatini]|uniref:hypothetical protein n=1 Tax=Micromonospora sp. JCM 30529 TaxID=3421643 RepID=UPI003D16A966